jgi:hypothetical protein
MKIIGVHHRNNEEALEVFNRIKDYDLKIVGLELPTDYLLRETTGLTYGFFSPLKKLLVNDNIEVVGLEDSEARDLHTSTEYAKAITDGRLSTAKLEEMILRTQIELENCDGYTCPSYEISVKHRYEMLTNAKQIDTEKAQKVWQESIDKRDRFMIENIQKQPLDIVIVGNGHALVLLEAFPESEYMLIDPLEVQ